MRLIINGDDLGHDAQTNAAIFDLMGQRQLTSATILANGPALEECLESIPAFPFCSFGIHLNITEFQPLTSSLPLKELLDPQGNFSLKNFKMASLTLPVRKAIFQEWSAQVRRLQARGLRISHIDSHHHVHTAPGLFLVLKRLQRTYGIRKVRLAYHISLDPKRFPERKNRLWNLALRYFYATTTTSGFADFSTFLQAWRNLARRHSTMEIMAHPGHPRFAAETRLLKTAWRGDLSVNTQLINYYDL